MTKTTQRNAETLFNDISESFLGTPNASGGAVHFDSGTGRPAKEWVAIDPSRRKEWLGLAKDAKKFVASSR